MEYSTLRAVHVTCVGISIGLFVARGAMQMRGVDWRRWRWLRIAPHVNDTLLLAAAVAMSMMSAQYPLAQPWLTAKVIGLVVYIALGRFALRPGESRRRAGIAFFGALATVAYIVGVALTRSVTLGWT